MQGAHICESEREHAARSTLAQPSGCSVVQRERTFLGPLGNYLFTQAVTPVHPEPLKPDFHAGIIHTVDRACKNLRYNI